MSTLHEWLARLSPEIASLLTAALALLVGLVVHAVLFVTLRRIARATPFLQDDALAQRARAPGLLVILVAALHFAHPSLSLESDAAGLLSHALSLLMIAGVTWLILRLIPVVGLVIVHRHRMDVSDNIHARRVHTQVEVIERVLSAGVVIIGVATMLMTFPQVRQLGASLLASAGIAGIILGLAARPTVSNFIAGLQIALTQPIRLDDVVVVRGEWGRIEEITTTYVVVRIWDQRRLIVPFSEFIENSFENWTRKSADILGSVIIHADYTVPVPAIRAELERIVQGNEDWDERVVTLQVTGATATTIELRALVSAADSSRAWNLRCLVREKLLAFLQREYPECLPKTRLAVEGSRGAPPAADTGASTSDDNAS